ncbi:hypothetical protein K402DRAFT_450626 [Aulographum hederae CBS 113979]|uniref:Uncharacterized protein n=1 Tax=Aulographum hederae CBS 113979 TaxID=1176131 RepID=A0A6G1HDC7_9PEZI|nr:hypothetical protein K402DRAFT_450626 [Aulographum hederae CBS 113979]
MPLIEYYQFPHELVGPYPSELFPDYPIYPPHRALLENLSSADLSPATPTRKPHAHRPSGKGLADLTAKTAPQWITHPSRRRLYLPDPWLYLVTWMLVSPNPPAARTPRILTHIQLTPWLLWAGLKLMEKVLHERIVAGVKRTGGTVEGYTSWRVPEALTDAMAMGNEERWAKLRDSIWEICRLVDDVGRMG